MKWKKATLILGLCTLLIGTAGIVTFNHMAKASGESWLSGWNYRKSIEITENNGENLINYQIIIDVNYGSGSDSGSSVYLDSNCSTDFSDIRFTDNNGETLLNYWIEDYTSSDDAFVWVKVPLIPDSSTTDIYIYYGNGDATSASDGYLTFPVFDDFDGVAINTTIWTESLEGWTRSVSDSELHLTLDSGTSHYQLNSKIAFDLSNTRKKMIMNISIKSLPADTSVMALQMLLIDRDGISNVQGMRWYKSGAYDRYILKQNGNTFWDGPQRGAIIGVSRLEYQFNPVGDTFRAIATGARTFNDLRTDTGDWDTYTAFVNLLFIKHPPNPDYDIRYIFVAEFVPYEPTITDYGDVEEYEEEPPPPPPPETNYTPIGFMFILIAFVMGWMLTDKGK